MHVEPLQDPPIASQFASPSVKVPVEVVAAGSAAVSAAGSAAVSAAG